MAVEKKSYSTLHSELPPSHRKTLVGTGLVADNLTVKLVVLGYTVAQVLGST